MPLPSKRDPEDLRRRLAAWFSAALGTSCEIGPVSVPEGTGMSSETLLFDLIQDGGAPEPVVTRLRPDMTDWPVFQVYDLAAQAGAMRLVAAHSDVPVPNIRHVEVDDSHVGAPFIVMDRVDGRALPDMPPYVFGGSWLDELTDDDRRTIQRETSKVLARLHAIDITAADMSFVGHLDPAESGQDALRRHLAEQRAYYDWGRGDLRCPIIERALEHLEATLPTDPGPTGLVWGDARPGNILFDGLSPVAVLDWEMVNLGPAGIDVGWTIFMHQFFQSLCDVFELPGFPDFCRIEHVVADYEAAGGRRIDDLDWYVTFASTRFAIVSIRTSLREVAYGNRPAADDPEDLLMNRGLLARALGEE
jgi:aminoglycoside phosphotransferase (APT) family kinase protein